MLFEIKCFNIYLFLFLNVEVFDKPYTSPPIEMMSSEENI